MSNLYELTSQFQTLMDMLEDTEVEEQAILDTLESITYDIEEKADGYGKIIKSIESDIEGIDSEIKRLSSKKNTYKNRIQFLKNNLKYCMDTMGKRKISTQLFTFNIQKNGGKRKLILDTDIENIPEEYRVKQPDIVDNEALRNYLMENGEEGWDGSLNCSFAHLEPQGETLRIK